MIVIENIRTFVENRVEKDPVIFFNHLNRIIWKDFGHLLQTQ